MHTSDRQLQKKKTTQKANTLCSPNPTSLPQLLGNKRLAEPVVEAVEVQRGCRLAARGATQGAVVLPDDSKYYSFFLFFFPIFKAFDINTQTPVHMLCYLFFFLF